MMVVAVVVVAVMVVEAALEVLVLEYLAASGVQQALVHTCARSLATVPELYPTVGSA